MPGTPMPKASIHKNGELLFGKSEVGAAKDWQMAPPAGYTILAEKACQRLLRVTIAPAANAGHHLRPLLP